MPSALKYEEGGKKMKDTLLSVKNLTKEFRVGSIISGKKIIAVNNVSFDLFKDEPVILSIVGESGCGKTTLTKMILRLLEQSAGEITLEGKNLADKRKISNKNFHQALQPIFQNPFEAFSSRRQVDKYLYDTARAYGNAKNKEEAIEKVKEALIAVGLQYENVKGKYSTQFSGGELQRVSIARALITSPKIIVADEPVAMIDASMKMNIVNLFKSIKEKYGISFIYITHDLSTAYYVSDYIATLYKGYLIEYGKSADIMDHPAHPYTQLLMGSVPAIGEKWKKEESVAGIEAGEEGNKGCPFYPRCTYAKEKCKNTMPEDVTLENGRKVLCFFPLQ